MARSTRCRRRTSSPTWARSKPRLSRRGLAAERLIVNGPRGFMNVINGLPAHVLLLHVVVVLVPLTALLVILCGLWPAARRGQLLWLTLALATATMILTPITIDAGEWLYDLRTKPSPILREHAERGETMVYFAGALLAVAIGLVVLRLIERGSD